MADVLKIGMRVWISVPDKPELDDDGFILAGPITRGDDHLFQVDMGDHDNWFPESWIRPFTGMEY